MSGPSLRELEEALDRDILEGRALEAFERYYADDVQMRENSGPPTIGKEANRSRELEFFGSVAEVHEIRLLASAVGEGVTLSEWRMDLTFRDGTRKRLEQVAVRRWRDGRVVAERFYYDPS